MAFSLAACSAWELGPEPDNFVGGRGSAPQRLTDPQLEAITPVSPGDQAGGAAPLPGAALPTTQPATQAATAPGQPATQPGLVARPDLMPTETIDGFPLARPQDAPLPESVSVQDAILLSLQNNTDLRIRRYNVPLSRTNEEQARAAFDPTVTFQLQGGRTGNNFGTTDSIAGSVGVTQFLPTGTRVQGTMNTNNSFYSDSSESLGANVSVTQALLRGAGLDVNLAQLRSAEINTRLSQYELRGVAESLVADVELAYWDLAYSERRLAIVQDAVNVAERQLSDTVARIEAGILAGSERPAAEAELANRRVELINARSSLETTRMEFLQLLSPAARQFWNRSINLTTLPFIPLGTMDPVDAHVAVALRMRPDVNQTKLQMQQGDLNIIVTKNGLLPRLDVFAQLGKTGTSGSFGEAILGFNGPNYQAILGIQGDWDPINRGPKAAYLSAQLSRERLDETMNNLFQVIQLQVRTQYAEVNRTRQQIDASRIRRLAQEQQVIVEQELLRTGRGKSLDVAIAQRELLNAQLAEVQAVTDHLKALVNLYRQEGTLLLRRGLDAPGERPVEERPAR